VPAQTRNGPEGQLLVHHPGETSLSLRRLGVARASARAAGLEGPLFPWPGGSDGRDEAPTQLFNPRTDSWQPDNSRRQRHVGLAVAYSIVQYAEAGGDESFFADVGIDLVVDVARCFASMAILPLRHPRPSDIVRRMPTLTSAEDSAR
jgi:trehalose/maltose hydrolase-like predicted phosphorylase